MPRVGLAVIIAVLALLRGLATAGPSRIVLADPDPELQRAVATSLAPWKIEVRVEPVAPTDFGEARTRADAAGAQFLVWRRGTELVVYDRQRDAGDTRPTREGALDPVSAAGVALTVKTLLRLPPVEPGEPGTGEPGPVPPIGAPTSPGIGFGVEAGGALRVARGSETEVGARALAAVWVRPVLPLGLRLAVAVELGTRSDFTRAGFKGSAGAWSAVGAIGWVIPWRTWEVEPAVALGLQRASLSGTEMGIARAERTSLLVLRGSLAVRRWIGRWSLGATVGVEAIPGTPTYTRSMGAELYQVPSLAVAGGVVAGVDLGR